MNTEAAAELMLKTKKSYTAADKFTTPCFQAKVGTVELPVYGDDEKQTVEKAAF